MARPLSTEQFATECDRRLLDTFEVMLLLGLRNRTAVHKRVAAGTLPAPILSKANVSLWDADAIPTER
jgi:hypothetical protein